LLDFLEDRDVPDLVLEDRSGWTGPAMHPEWFFRSFEQWDWWDRKILPLVGQGPVLDLGAGAGRAPCTCNSGVCPLQLSMPRQVLPRCAGVGA